MALIWVWSSRSSTVLQTAEAHYPEPGLGQAHLSSFNVSQD